MKRLDGKRKLRLEEMRQKRWRRKLRRGRVVTHRIARIYPKAAPVRVLQAPEIFSFSRKYDESVSFLKAFKDAAFKANRGIGERIALEFTSIREISLAAAVVLSVERPH